MDEDTLKMLFGVMIAALLGVQLASIVSTQVTARTTFSANNETITSIVTNASRTLAFTPLDNAGSAVSGTPCTVSATCSVIVTNGSITGANVTALLAPTSYTISAATFTLTNNTWNNTNLRFVYLYVPSGFVNDTTQTVFENIPLIFTVLVLVAVVAYMGFI